MKVVLAVSRQVQTDDDPVRMQVLPEFAVDGVLPLGPRSREGQIHLVCPSHPGGEPRKAARYTDAVPENEGITEKHHRRVHILIRPKPKTR
jgi:hypothetical protein